MDVKDHISQIKEGIKAGQFVNEASVSQGIVLRILQALGWPIFDSRIVSPEYAVQGRRVDFALCHPPTKPLVFIEVKQIGQSEGADKQLFEYAFHLGVPMAVLTDGQEWHFYLPGEQGLYQERRVYKLDLLERSVEECALRMNRYLEYEASTTGRTLDAARKDYRDIAKERQIDTTLPIAWAKLLEESDDLLIELIADKVESLCGFKPDPDRVASFLGSSERRVINNKPQIPTQTAKNPLSSNKAQPLASLGYRYRGQQYQAKNARGVLIGVLSVLLKEDSTFLERFAARPKHGKKRRFIARSKGELYPERPDLGELHSYEIAPGWWVGTNYSRENIEKIIVMACEVAGITYRKDLVVRLE